MPETKSVKNRLHIDVGVSDGPQIGAAKKREQVMPMVERLVALGATFGHEVQEQGSFWVVMRDPEGNEFCVT